MWPGANFCAGAMLEQILDREQILGREQILVFGGGRANCGREQIVGRELILVLGPCWSRFWPGADFGFELILGLELNFVMF